MNVELALFTLLNPPDPSFIYRNNDLIQSKNYFYTVIMTLENLWINERNLACVDVANDQFFYNLNNKL